MPIHRVPAKLVGLLRVVVVAVAVLGGSARLSSGQEQAAPGTAHLPDVEGMILIPAGEFKMGSSSEDRFADSDEKPQRIVHLPAFYIDQFEISNLDYKRFIDAVGYPPPPGWKDGNYAEGADFFPVYDVSWWEAAAYARWAGKRLPTEAEWEKAARGTDGRRFPWGNESSDDMANSGPGYAPINAFLEGASVYGVVNMAGNVAEWTSSVYEPYPELDAVLPAEFGGMSEATEASQKRHRRLTPASDVAAKTGKRPWSDDPRLMFFTGEELMDTRDRVYRGGSINNYWRFLRAANRERSHPGRRWYNIGFRCAMDAPPPGDDDAATGEWKGR
ncbi:MAG: formylglycine-generating enzyme family protein [Candidatus Krumholzibacteriia bacterium]